MTDPPFPFGDAPRQGPDPESVAQPVATIAARSPVQPGLLPGRGPAGVLAGRPAYARCKPELSAGVLSPPLMERHRGALSLSATASNASRYRSWTTTTASNAVLTVQPSGGGDLKFANLPLSEPGSTRCRAT